MSVLERVVCHRILTIQMSLDNQEFSDDKYGEIIKKNEVEKPVLGIFISNFATLVSLVMSSIFLR